MSPKNKQRTSAETAGSAPTPKPQGGLWLEISPPLAPSSTDVVHGANGSPSLALVPGQTHTLKAQGSRRYRLGLRDPLQHTEAGASTAHAVLVLRHGDDLWLSNAQAATLVVNGFFATPENQLEIEQGDQTWRLDGWASTATPPTQ